MLVLGTFQMLQVQGIFHSGGTMTLAAGNVSFPPSKSPRFAPVKLNHSTLDQAQLGMQAIASGDCERHRML